MLHAGRGISGGGGGCERGERRRTDGSHMVLADVVSAGGRGGTARHHESGTGRLHRAAAGLLEGVVVLVMMQVGRGQRWRRVQRHRRAAAIRRAGRTASATTLQTRDAVITGRLYVHAFPVLVVVVVRRVHVLFVHGSRRRRRPNGPGVREQSGHAELDVAGRSGGRHHGRRSGAAAVHRCRVFVFYAIVVVVVVVVMDVVVYQVSGPVVAHHHIGGCCTGQHPLHRRFDVHLHVVVVVVHSDGHSLLLLLLQMMMWPTAAAAAAVVVGGRRWRQQMVER